MEFNLSLYKIFAIVAQTGSISGAAKKLYISQPAISKSISNLEESLDMVLFVRTSRGVTLTDEGKLLYKHVSEAFRTLEAGENELKRFKELGIGHLTIGVSNTLCKYILLPYLKIFVAEHPHISINIMCQSTNETLQYIEDGTVDIGLIARQDNMRDMSYQAYGAIEDVFAATPSYLSHLSQRTGALTATELISQGTLMLLDKGNATRQFVDNYLEENHIHAANLIETTDMDLLMEFARTSLGIACVIKNFIQDDLDHGTLVEVSGDKKLRQREIGFAWQKDHVPHKALDAFLDFIGTRM